MAVSGVEGVIKSKGAILNTYGEEGNKVWEQWQKVLNGYWNN